jgi:hypothetical protein
MPRDSTTPPPAQHGEGGGGLSVGAYSAALKICLTKMQVVPTLHIEKYCKPPKQKNFEKIFARHFYF